jgi:hypothetical protein
MTNPDERILILQQKIWESHNCETVHIQTVSVEETADGKVLWAGEVEIFEVKGHPKAKTAYGWEARKGDQEVEWITILGLTPTIDARKAVQAYLMSGPEI